MKRQKFVIFYRKQDHVYKYIVKATCRQYAAELFTRLWPRVEVVGITTMENYRQALNRV